MMVQRFCQTYKKRLASPDLWLDCLSIWLLSVGTVLAFDQLFRFHAEWGEILWFPAVLIVALVLLTRVGWVLPAFLLGAGCLFALVSGGLESQLEYFHGFLGWWMDLFPVSSICLLYTSTTPPEDNDSGGVGLRNKKREQRKTSDKKSRG